MLDLMRASARSLSILVFVGMMASGQSRSEAGPARLDPEKRSISFNYTYASLVDGQVGEAAIGAPQTAQTEQDAKVRSIFLIVSDTLSKATAGRAKISSLNLVQDAKSADIVISLTGNPGRGGWAIQGAIEGAPGQVGLYYEVLSAEWEQDFVLTAAHEICHYMFGLADEYNFARGCPIANPGGPGCLMDNYLSNGTRHGWYGRFCDSTDHNNDPIQVRPCQAIVDKFFDDRQISKPPTTAASPQNTIEGLLKATSAKVQEEAEARNKAKTSGSLFDLSSLRTTVAKDFFERQLKQNNIKVPSADRMSGYLDRILKDAIQIVSVDPPVRLTLETIKVLGNRAQELAKDRDIAKEPEAKRQSKILDELKSMIGEAPETNGKPTQEELQYTEFLTRQAIAKFQEKDRFASVYDATLNLLKLQRESAGTILDIASESGVVGIESRLAALGDIDADLRQTLPGRTASTGFGRRRTIIIDPDPLDPRMDYVNTQSGLFRYRDLREKYTNILSALLERAKVERLPNASEKRRLEEKREQLKKGPEDQARDEQERNRLQLLDINKVRVQREADLREQINDLLTNIRRNRLENIVFMVPPGGLPEDLGGPLEALRRELIIKGDVRLDIVLIGAVKIPFELRDIASRTGGSIVSLVDLDEIGSVAQRLKNEQTTGAWVVLPQQGEITNPALRAEVTSRDQKTWLAKDPIKGRFLDNPIQPHFTIASAALIKFNVYFRSNSRSDPPYGFPPNDDENNNQFKQIIRLNPGTFLFDQRDSNLISLDKSKEINEHIYYTINGTRYYDLYYYDPPERGLIYEFKRLIDLVGAYNSRKPGVGVDNYNQIIDHVINAREYIARIKNVLVDLEDEHARVLAPDYQEPAVEVVRNFDETMSALRLEEPRKVGMLSFQANRPSKYRVDLTNYRNFVNSLLQEETIKYAYTKENLGEENFKKWDSTVKNLIDKGDDLMKAFDELEKNYTLDNTKSISEIRDNWNRVDLISKWSNFDGKFSEYLDIIKKIPDPLTISRYFLNPPPALQAPNTPRNPNLPSRRTPRFTLEGNNLQSRSGDIGLLILYPKTYFSIHEFDQLAVRYGLPQGSPPPSQEATPKDPFGRSLAPFFSDLTEKTEKNNAATYAYVQLRKYHRYIDLVSDFLLKLEGELGENPGKLPLFRRVNREEIIRASQRIQDQAPGFLKGLPGFLERAPLAPVDSIPLAKEDSPRAHRAYRLQRFYAENQKFDARSRADFELILGLSRALPGVKQARLRDAIDKLDDVFELKLYNDNGQPVETPTLALDRDVSQPDCLVYRFSPEFGETGWYTAALLIKNTTMQRIGGDTINYTFSVASSRPNIRLTAALVQTPPDPKLIPPPADRGIIRDSERRARVEVQVYGGTSVTGANVRGLLNKIDDGTSIIEGIAQDFWDDGKTYDDRKADDGIYTTLIPLARVEEGKEYRLSIQAESTQLSKNIPVEDPSVIDDRRRKEAVLTKNKDIRLTPVSDDDNKLPETVSSLVFQRATSIQIRIEH